MYYIFCLYVSRYTVSSVQHQFSFSFHFSNTITLKEPFNISKTYFAPFILANTPAPFLFSLAPGFAPNFLSSFGIVTQSGLSRFQRTCHTHMRKSLRFNGKSILSRWRRSPALYLRTRDSGFPHHHQNKCKETKKNNTDKTLYRIWLKHKTFFLLLISAVKCFLFIKKGRFLSFFI